MRQGKLLALDIKPGEMPETRSGIQAFSPKIYARLADSGCAKDCAFLVVHPTNNFMNHYLVEPLERLGRAVLALNTRYLGNEAFLVFERAIQDVGSGIRYLREAGYRHVCLIGNSGGAALAALYQAQAERLTITATPAGDPVTLTPDDLPPADSIALIAAHPGRARTLTTRLDAAVIDEADIFATDPSLDIFESKNGPPFSEEFLSRLRAAQIARNRRITEWCQARLRQFEALSSEVPIRDQNFIVYRTMADPRFIDLTLEPNGRKPGTALTENARAANLATNGTAALASLRSWLSQWSYDHSRADGPVRISETSVPTLVIDYAADEIVYPSDREAWLQALGARATMKEIAGAGHYPQKTPGLVDEVAQTLVGWVEGQGKAVPGLREARAKS